ncbi:hypothetical protein OY671_008548, partial [Metschnikowia pulcherrima]
MSAEPASLPSGRYGASRRSRGPAFSLSAATVASSFIIMIRMGAFTGNGPEGGGQSVAVKSSKEAEASSAGARKATREIKAACPHVHISGGSSNLSFSFRGNETVRRAMHSVFLYHAIPAGMDMAIVNAGQLDIYDQIDPVSREACEDVLSMRRADATERSIDSAES